MSLFISRQGLLSQRDPGMADTTGHTKYFLYERCSSSNNTECSGDPPPSQLVITSSGESQLHYPPIRDIKLAEFRMDEFQHAEWAGDGLLLVHQNDVYYLADPASPSSVERITKTGSSFVFHGLAQGIYYGSTDITLIPLDQAKCFR